jgi:ligand-binding sensor domain-containing protein
MKTSNHPSPHALSGLGLGLVLLATANPRLWAEPASDLPFPLVERFESFGSAHGIPANKVHAVLKTTSSELWIGTWNGLCRREQDGNFSRLGPEHGLSHKMVLSLAEDPQTGDLWVGTMRGLNHVSAGKITAYTQTDCGLPNNVVYAVEVIGHHVWVATAAGAAELNLKTGAWKIYDHNNSLMHEPWCYSVSGAGDNVFIGVWGGGIMEHDPKLGTFKEYRDPDRDFHLDLVPDDGPINDITAWLDWENGVLWQCTYFGMSRYDGRNWKTWVEGKSPLLSNFTQFVWAHRGVAWIGMDRGLSVTDGITWVNYLVDDEGQGSMEIHRPHQPAVVRPTATALANQFVLGIQVDDEEAWFATSKGLSRGILTKPAKLTRLSEAHSKEQAAPHP